MITFEQYYNRIQELCDKYLINDLCDILIKYLYLKNINICITKTKNKDNKNIDYNILKIDYSKNIQNLKYIVIKNLIYYEYKKYIIFVTNKNRIFLYEICTHCNMFICIHTKNWSNNVQFENESKILQWIDRQFCYISDYKFIKNMLQN